MFVLIQGYITNGCFLCLDEFKFLKLLCQFELRLRLVDDAAEKVDVGGFRFSGLKDVVLALAVLLSLVAVAVDVPSHDA